MIFFSMKVQVSPWLAGKVSGICGKFDAETEQEFQTATGYLAKDAVSFVQSWVEDSDMYKGKQTLSLAL